MFHYNFPCSATSLLYLPLLQQPTMRNGKMRLFKASTTTASHCKAMAVPHCTLLYKCIQASCTPSYGSIAVCRTCIHGCILYTSLPTMQALEQTLPPRLQSHTRSGPVQTAAGRHSAGLELTAHPPSSASLLPLAACIATAEVWCNSRPLDRTLMRSPSSPSRVDFTAATALPKQAVDAAENTLDMLQTQRHV